MRLSEALAYWSERSQAATSTRNRYARSIARLARRGLAHVEDLTRERVADVQGALLASGWTVDSVRAEMIALRSVLRALDDDRLLAPGQLASIRKTALRRQATERRHRVRFLSRTEFDTLASGAARLAPRFELPIRFAVLAGPRVGELSRIRAEDVRAGALSIVTRPEYGEAGSCKTGPRVVPVCRELQELVDARLPREGWFFPSLPCPRKDQPTRPFMSRGTLERGLRNLRRTLGMADDITWIVLRHTRASWWLQGGASIYKVADWLGHSVLTCETFYGSLLDGYDSDCERMPAAS